MRGGNKGGKYMRLELLKSVVRSAMRTANRRLKQWQQSGINNPSFEDIKNRLMGSSFFGTNKKGESVLKMGGLDKRGLQELYNIQQSLKELGTPNQYEKKYRKLADQFANNDINIIGRAFERFRAIHGVRYEEYLEYVEKNGINENNMKHFDYVLKQLIMEEMDHEFTEQEVETFDQKTDFEKF